MRLLNVHTRRLEEFNSHIPPFAILSHTWESDEVTFQDLPDPHHPLKLGYAKIDGCCRRAIQDNLYYVWVDTCCIDKSSSAELSEAINSMYQWYAKSAACYAYLSDAVPDEHIYPWDSSFRRSRWFTRGWTLQELLAPFRVYFFDQDWNFAGTRKGLANILSDITGILPDFLNGRAKIHDACIAMRMSWASRRVTTRTEDMAYCLLGLLGVSMPPLYGEGDRAFVRLQEEVIKGSTDQSFLAWGYGLPWTCPGRSPNRGVLALTPAVFEHGGDIRTWTSRKSPHFLLTNRGLQIELPLKIIDRKSGVVLALLECLSYSSGERLAIPLSRAKGKDDFIRAPGSRLIAVSKRQERMASRRKIFIHECFASPRQSGLSVELRTLGLKDHGYTLATYYPPDVLDPGQLKLYRASRDVRKFLLVFSKSTKSGDSLLVHVEARWSTVDGELRSLKAQGTRTNSLSCLEHLLRGSSKVSFSESLPQHAWMRRLLLRESNSPLAGRAFENIVSINVDEVLGRMDILCNSNAERRDAIHCHQGSPSKDISEDGNNDITIKELASRYRDGIQDFLMLNRAPTDGGRPFQRRQISDAVLGFLASAEQDLPWGA
jgi:hypothetical protein